MSANQSIVIAVMCALLAGCGGGFARKEIEGNNTGGVVPPALAQGNSVQALADAHCAQWGTRARITYDGTQTSADSVFVCETAAGPAVFGAPKSSVPGSTAPAPQQAPAKR